MYRHNILAIQTGSKLFSLLRRERSTAVQNNGTVCREKLEPANPDLTVGLCPPSEDALPSGTWLHFSSKGNEVCRFAEDYKAPHHLSLALWQRTLMLLSRFQVQFSLRAIIFTSLH